jgi:tetratricopeptide (TPR) repeat protein
MAGSECPILDCHHDLSPDQWRERPIAASFDEWLVRIFDDVVEHQKGLLYWYEINNFLEQDMLFSLLHCGRRKMQQEDYEEAIALFHQVTQSEFPYNAAYYSAHYELGNAFLHTKKYVQAIESYSEAIQNAPMGFATVYNYRGLASVGVGDYLEAIQDFNQALAFDSNFREAYQNRGDAYSTLGNQSEAEEDYKRVAECFR